MPRSETKTKTKTGDRDKPDNTVASSSTIYHILPSSIPTTSSRLVTGHDVIQVLKGHRPTSCPTQPIQAGVVRRSTKHLRPCQTSRHLPSPPASTLIPIVAQEERCPPISSGSRTFLPRFHFARQTRTHPHDPISNLLAAPSPASKRSVSPVVRHEAPWVVSKPTLLRTASRVREHQGCWTPSNPRRSLHLPSKSFANLQIAAQPPSILPTISHHRKSRYRDQSAASRYTMFLMPQNQLQEYHYLRRLHCPRSIPRLTLRPRHRILSMRVRPTHHLRQRPADPATT